MHGGGDRWREGYLIIAALVEWQTRQTQNLLP